MCFFNGSCVAKSLVQILQIIFLGGSVTVAGGVCISSFTICGRSKIETSFKKFFGNFSTLQEKKLNFFQNKYLIEDHKYKGIAVLKVEV